MSTPSEAAEPATPEERFFRRNEFPAAGRFVGCQENILPTVAKAESYRFVYDILL